MVAKCPFPAPSLFLSLQMNSVWTISAGATWSHSTASVTTSSTDSSAASPAPARGRRALTHHSLCGFQASEGNHTAETIRGGNYSRDTELCSAICVFFLEYLSNEFWREEKVRNHGTLFFFFFLKEGKCSFQCSSAKAVSSHHCPHWVERQRASKDWCNMYMLSLDGAFSVRNLWNYKPSREQKRTLAFAACSYCMLYI